MKKVLLYGGLALGGVFVLLVAGAGALYASTAGDYAVPATVDLDPGLPRIKVNGHLVHAERFGDPDNPTVLVLHGGPGGDYRSLLGLQELADQYHVVFYDQRGAGLSQRLPAEQVTYQALLEDLDLLVDRFGGGRPVHLVGHSWGAMLASAYLGIAPEKVGKTVLAEPGYLDAAGYDEWQQVYASLMSGPGYAWTALRAGFKAQHVRGPDAYAAEDYLVGEVILDYFTNHPDNPYHCPGEAYTAPKWRWGTTASNAMQASLTAADLDGMSAHAGDHTGPVLFLAGACNTWIGADLQRTHAARFADAAVQVIPDAGHDMFWDNPTESIAAVRAFLND